jgi:D-alanyl-lipoteichoic acid acyltransferase DltB (MBOAT superfamily)
MLFNSYEYIFFFLPIVIIGFFFIGKRGHHEEALAWLVGASLFFYGWWNPVYVSLITGSIIFNYAVGIQLQHRKNVTFCRGLIWFGVVANLSLIGYFKYVNFFIGNLNVALGTAFYLEKIILPLGISFFTFTQIAYLLDAYKRKIREHNFLHYCLFVTFFPHLLAGPILHHKDIMPQFKQRSIYKPNAQNFAIGITVFFIGLFKKVILADGVAQYASPVFSSAEKGAKLITFFDAWGGALAYTLQIYFDFSGYTDMAIGSALMFGISLPLNFNSPYKSLNIIDFWRRWHMTLSRFMRDYLYIPLGGSYGGTTRKLNNLMVTMALGGFWHGAGWTFVIWGALHGFYLIMNHSWRTFREKVLGHDLSRSSFIGRTISILLTMLAVIIGWVVFRATTIEGASKIFYGMIGMNGATIPDVIANIHPVTTILINKLRIQGVAESGLVFTTKWATILLISLVLFLPNSIQYVNSIFSNNKIPRIRLFAHATLTSIMIIWAVMAIGKPSEFLYFQF